MNAVWRLRFLHAMFSMLVILAVHRNGMHERAGLITPANPSLLTPEWAWQVPVARLPAAVNFLDWRFPIFAIVMGLVVARTVQGSGETSAWERVLATMGLSLIAEPRDLIPATLMSLVLVLPASGVKKARWFSLLIFGVSIFVTLEFGLIGFFVGTSLGFRNSNETEMSRFRRNFPLLCLVLITMVAALSGPGFRSAGLRSLSAFWLDPPSGLIPSLESFGGLRTQWLAWLCLLPLVVLSGADLWKKSRSARVGGAWCLWLILGITIPRYSCLAMIAISLLSRERILSQFVPVRPVVLWSVCLVGAISWVAVTSNISELVLGTSLDQRLHPELWNTQGTVVLTNLDRSSEWQATNTASSFRLLLDDRWDCMGDRYREHAALCRDLCEGRDHRYLRRDSTWGGYKLSMKEWNLAIVAVDTTDVNAVRWLSQSPDWRVMGIDGEQALLGNVAVTSNRPSLGRTVAQLMSLEWKSSSLYLGLDSHLRTGNAESNDQLAQAVCSMTFPFAALRLARVTAGRNTDSVRASCYVELSHRISGHASCGSLLDQYRAHCLCQRVLRKVAPESKAAIRLTRGLQALDRLVPDLGDSASTEDQLRAALLTGESKRAEELVEILPSSLLDYYRVILNSPDLSPEQLQTSLQAAISHFPDTVPTDTRAEALFYWGCAALEEGDTTVALDAFEQSENLSPHSAFHQIRDLYRRQVSR